MQGVYMIVTAAGSGSRMNAGKNKVLLNIGKRSILEHTLAAIKRAACFETVIISVQEEDRETVEKSAKRLGINFKIAKGGAERQDSVANALKLVPDTARVVAVHDAARCMAGPKLFRRCVESAIACGSGVAGKYAVDTVKCVKDGEIVETLNRSETVLIETPQAFAYPLLKKAYEKAYEDGFIGTDDSSLVERLGIRPRLILSKEKNFKITVPQDLEAGKKVMGSIRIGHGYDVHGFTEDRPLVIGGVEIPYEMGLAGHSDADVLLHAIIDALFGAAGMPDIGHAFPETDDRYKGISSLILLEEAADMLSGFTIVNIDATVIAQKPKLADYIDEMRENIAAILKTDVERVNVKATTTEGLGFAGRCEGIAAHAVCLLNG